MTIIVRQAIRFGVVGAVNTILTYGIYLLGLTALDYRGAYALAFCCGIAFALIANARYVFRARITRFVIVFYPVIYLIQFCLGLIILQIAVANLGITPRWAALFSIACTIPLTFALSRLVFRVGEQRSRNSISRI